MGTIYISQGCWGFTVRNSEKFPEATGRVGGVNKVSQLPPLRAQPWTPGRKRAPEGSGGQDPGEQPPPACCQGQPERIQCESYYPSFSVRAGNHTICVDRVIFSFLQSEPHVTWLRHVALGTKSVADLLLWSILKRWFLLQDGKLRVQEKQNLISELIAEGRGLVDAAVAHAEAAPSALAVSS